MYFLHIQASFIPLDASCTETKVKNPAIRPTSGTVRVSGHMVVNAADGSLPQAALDTIIMGSGLGTCLLLA
jgi:hypothetical protein